MSRTWSNQVAEALLIVLTYDLMMVLLYLGIAVS